MAILTAAADKFADPAPLGFDSTPYTIRKDAGVLAARSTNTNITASLAPVASGITYMWRHYLLGGSGLTFLAGEASKSGNTPLDGTVLAKSLVKVTPPVSVSPVAAKATPTRVGTKGTRSPANPLAIPVRPPLSAFGTVRIKFGKRADAVW
jgi:hypothetical protein